MSQDTTNMRSRAISTARFLMTSQSFAAEEAKEKRREIWDAANRQVVLTDTPLTYVEADPCSPLTRSPSKPSLMDIISGKSGFLDSLPPDGSSSPTSLRSPGSSKNVRPSLTGHQWGGVSPAVSAGSDGNNSRTGACRTNNMDVHSAAVPDEQQRMRKGVAGRRHSVQVLERQTSDGLSQASSPKSQMYSVAALDAQQSITAGKARRHSVHIPEQTAGSQYSISPKSQMRVAAVSDIDEQQHASKGTSRRRHSVHITSQQGAASPPQSSSPKSQMRSAAVPDEQQHASKGTSRRRHSVHIPAQQDAQSPPQSSSPKSQVQSAAVPGEPQSTSKGKVRRHSVQIPAAPEGPAPNSSPKSHMYSAASLAAISRHSSGDSAAVTHKAAPVSSFKVPPLRLQDDPAGDRTYHKSKSTPFFDVEHVHKTQTLNRSKTGLDGGHAGNISTSSDGTDGSMSGAITFRRYVPQIDKIDSKALQRGGEGDCTAYDTLLDASILQDLRAV